MKTYLTIILMTIILSGCGDISVNHGGDIIAVYFHEHNSYSVAILTTNNKVIIKPLPSIGTELFSDVNAGQPNWYKCDYTYNPNYHNTSGGCEIHIKHISDMNTGSWNHGKFGSGTTTRID